MLSRLKKSPKYIFIFLLLFVVKTASAQNKYDAISFRIDSLAAVGLPKSALKEVDKLDKLAHDEKNTAQQIRAVIYRITFQSYIEENALVAIISRLKKDIAQAQYPAKPVMQSMLAEMYWNYYKDHRYEYSQRSRLLTPGDDYTQWDLQTIISETGRQYKLSLAYAKQEQETPITLLDGVLTGDKTTRYLRPTLYDLLAQRALDFYLDDEPEIVKPKMAFSLKDPGFFSDGLTFTKLPVNTTDTASTWYQGIKLLQQATVFHLQTPDEQALANLNLQRLKFLHEKSNLTDADSLYIVGLKQIANKFSAQPISVQALSLLGFYYKALDSLVTARGFFEAAKTAFPTTMGGKNAANYIGEIDRKELSATVEDVSAPDKPILAQLTYRNVKQVKFSVYGVTDDKIKEFKNRNKQDDDNDLTLNEAVYGLLKKLKPVETAELTLPDNHDYRNHKTEFEIAPLHPGNYIIVVEEPSAGKSAPIGLAQFRISGLSYTTRQRPDGIREVWVMDRDSGRPLKGVKVKVYNTYNDKGKIIRNPIGEGLSNTVGVFTFSCRGDYYNVNLSTGNDSFTDRANYVSGPLEKPLKEPLLTSHTILFTDRRIYRPGQTVYFKGLRIKTYNNKSAIVPGENIQVTLLDANRQKQGELNLATNEYGSIAGSFIIPQHITNGVMFVTTANGSVPIRVEEYKRPTFQLAFTPIKETYRFNDSVHVKGKVTAFSGYGISGANVAYVIKRTPNYNAFYVDSRKYDVYDYSDAEISSDTIKTDINGEFKLAFKAIPGEGKALDSYEYTITADVTDGSGETQSANTSVNVGNSVLDLALDVPGELFVKDKAVIPVKLNNQNGQRQSGVLEVKLYALKQPDALFKNRLWDAPDQYILSRDQYKKLFPGYAYANEDDQKTWKPVKTIIDANINITDTTNTYLDLSPLQQQLTGVYKLVVNARNVKWDTTSKTFYFNFYRDPGKAAAVDDWVTAVTDKVDKAGDTARFWIGINRESHVLVEKYQGPKLLSSVWVTVGPDGQQELKVPVPASGKNNFAVQLLMVNDNRLYSYYKPVAINDTVAALKVRLLTFRDKLQPGQKEQWKLQVSGQDDGKVQAEMLAGMYDASLDAITPAQNWNQQLPADNYNPRYFEWRIYDAFVNRVNTESFNELPYYDIDIPDFYYERINWFGYSYFGGDNSGYGSYLESVKENIKYRASDRKIEAAYTTNALKVKNGYVVSGRVLNNWLMPEAGVKISIKGSGISTYSNSLGYYKIKIPYKATLIFAKKYCDTRYVMSPSNGNVFITSNVVRFPPPVVVADMEVKEQKSDPNAEVRIDEPVGNSDMKGAAEANVAAFKTPRVVGAKVNGKSFGYFANNYTVNDKDILRKKQNAPVAMMYDEMRSPLIPRKNFNETAFFYPQLRTDEKGQVLIEFTIPEALTKWKFRAFAHNKQLQFGYTEAEVVTQKQLSITANMPRFLREGDTVTISARLANLETAQLKGTVELKLFNAVNMQPVGLFINQANAKQAFEIDGSSTKSVSFKLVIPAGLDALTYRLTADAGKFTDGEENTLPILPNRMLVTESMPMMIRAGQSKTFSFDKLINQNSTTLQNKTLTLEYTQNPAWYAVQTIPYMMEFPYECSEQLFSRYYANSLSTDLIAKMPVIKQVFDRWKNSDSKELLSSLEKNQELKATLLEETPWLQDAVSESEQKKRIAQLFDLNKMSYEMKANLDKLKQKQLPNGAFPWFGGDYADDYITRHVLEGIGQLYHLKITTADNKTLKDIADKALGYMDAELLKADKEAKKQKKYESRDVDAGEVHAWYVCSYFTDKPIGTELKAAFNNYLKRAEDQWVTQGIYQQGMIALTMARNGKLPVAKAIVKSLMETAQQSDEMGMYWGKNLSGYYWYQSPIETQSLMIELFTELGGNAKAVEEMKVWLMRNKQTNSWQTTKATAAAVYALLLKQESWLKSIAPAEIKINGSSLASLKPDIKADAGTGYIKTNWVDEQIKSGMGRVEVKNNGQSISYGAMYWQYLEQMDKITPAQTDLSLERKYFIKKQTDAGPVLQEVDATHQPKTGDLLKVVVYLKAGRDYEYVQLKDLRAAGTEPVSVLSEYKYQDGLSYYQVTKDVATNFFISHLNKGNYVFEYELRVAQPGSFSTGIACIQCMYAPEFNAHSEGRRVVFKP